MNTNDYIEFFDELDNNEQTLNYMNLGKRRQDNRRNPKKKPESVQQFIRTQSDSRANFEFTYQAARHEAGWLLESLGGFYEHKWIEDVLRQVKGGKEASVYLCKSGIAEVEYLAAKVYRPRQLRNLKNDHLYRTGRVTLDEDGKLVKNEKELHAIAKRSSFGEALRHRSWIAYEYQAMEKLVEAGADLPVPYAMEHNAILMGYVGDVDSAAPTLNTVRLDKSEARRLFERILHNIDLMLANRLIHADLSAYNILYWDREITLIDFPQVVAPEANPMAYSIFRRDVQRVCQYFEGQGIPSNASKLARQLWEKHGHKPHKDVDPAHLDADNPDDRAAWRKQQAH